MVTPHPAHRMDAFAWTHAMVLSWRAPHLTQRTRIVFSPNGVAVTMNDDSEAIQDLEGQLVLSDSHLTPGQSYQWLPVSEGYPACIRPLGGTGFEVALYLKELPNLGRCSREVPEGDGVALVRAIGAAIAAQT